MKIVFPILAGCIVLFVGIYVSGQMAFYEDFPYFDSVMHVLGGAVIGWLVFAHASVKGRPTPSLGLVLLIAIVIGLLWELAEYTSGLTMQGTVVYKYFHGGGCLDSLSDLAMAVLGATIAFILHPKKLDSFKGLDT